MGVSWTNPLLLYEAQETLQALLLRGDDVKEGSDESSGWLQEVRHLGWTVVLAIDPGVDASDDALLSPSLQLALVKEIAAGLWLKSISLAFCWF